MSGFFKKLFNRILGKKEEASPPATEAPPAPVVAAEEVVPETVGGQPVVAEPAPPQATEKRVAVDPERPAAKKPLPRKPAAKASPPHVKPAKRAAAGPLKAKAKAKPEPTASKPAARRAEPERLTKKEAPKPKDQKPPRAAAEKTLGAKVENRAKVPPSPPVQPPAALSETKAETRAEPPATPPSVPSPSPVSPLPAPAPAAVLPPTEQAPQERKGWFSRLKEGLSKSSRSLTGSITAIFTKRKLDAATLQELEDTLIQADLGIAVAERIISKVSAGRYDKEIDPAEVKQILADEVAKVLKPVEAPFSFGSEQPFVILVVGVNGSGKTTTIGKLGAIATREGFKVKFAACDTFRAAAIEQLTVWGQRIGAETVARPPGSDAAGLAYDAVKLAREDGTDIVFIDTAGRLHNKVYLMDELDKVVRVIKKLDAAAPHAVLLVLDATTGQNALAQAEAFTKVAGVTGIIMTKLDGTARGGILVAIAERFKLPVHAIGVGETIDDLQPFDAEGFARAIAGLEEGR